VRSAHGSGGVGREPPGLDVLVVDFEEGATKLFRLVHLFEFNQELHDVGSHLEGWLIRLIKAIGCRKGLVRHFFCVVWATLTKSEICPLNIKLNAVWGKRLCTQ
jgi:hypothetical protein